MPFPIIAAASIAAGVGLSLFGASKQEEQAEKAARAAAAAAKEQKKFAKQQNKIIEKTIKPLIAKQGEAQEKASAESRKAEELRRLQMRLDADRTRRDILRNRLFVSAVAKARAFAQGAEKSSGLMGSLGQITAQANRQLTALRQNLGIGEGIFSANIATSEFISEANKYGTQINLAERDLQTIQNKAAAAAGVANARVSAIASQNPGAVYSNIGSTLIGSAGTIDRLGTSALFGSSSTPWYSSGVGTSLVSQGSPFMDNAGNIYSY
jgi:hypothetical protein